MFVHSLFAHSSRTRGLVLHWLRRAPAVTAAVEQAPGAPVVARRRDDERRRRTAGRTVSNATVRQAALGCLTRRGGRTTTTMSPPPPPPPQPTSCVTALASLARTLVCAPVRLSIHIAASAPTIYLFDGIELPVAMLELEERRMFASLARAGDELWRVTDAHCDARDELNATLDGLLNREQLLYALVDAVVYGAGTHVLGRRVLDAALVAAAVDAPSPAATGMLLAAAAWVRALPPLYATVDSERHHAERDAALVYARRYGVQLVEPPLAPLPAPALTHEPALLVEHVRELVQQRQ